ncbi:hypothetical protein RHAL1_02539 [Beijerinckiaceae bacterium RH AL1]|nr:hypothetical protein RHCH11_RHCH11_02484 [Beijerinckiaceae bacterium RH CH11]VVB46989.1 hypothetical protein RHAL8_02480 [Beijerinckiaceae bacterium RH AL8]VVC55618.1 hypothetical protein RHAL1_02539 [Beijerinckiaceae bacterium RH AL1]
MLALARREAAEPALARLRAMARQRPVLAGGLDGALKRHAGAPATALDAWAAAILALANVNAGPGALLVAFRLAAALPPGDGGGLTRAAAGVSAAADICRWAGAGAVRAVLVTRLDLDSRLGSLPDEAVWWRTLVALAGEEPAAAAVAARTSGRVIAACGVAGFDAFVGAGLRASTRMDARLAFFGLRDPAAVRVLDRLSGETTFATMSTQLRAYVTALWGADIALQEAAPPRADRPRRATTTPGVVHVPDTLPGVSRDAAPALYRAIVAHASAHLALGSPRREPGTLKPLQIVLTGLIEDARIEALAMRRFPGLRRLWAPFHTIEPSHLKTAPILLARLARGLFDLEHPDDDAIVGKARALFYAEPDLADPGLSRRIGSILGNDIGQMRIQFDAKGHVIEQAYRDDNLGLWLLPPLPDGDVQALDLPVEAARVERRPADDGEREQGDAKPEAGRGRSVAPDDGGHVVAHYPEWDRAAALERPEWTTIREIDPARGDVRGLQAALAADAGLRRRVERLVRAARIGVPTRLKRQPDGLDLDLDAAIDTARALRSCETPDARVYLRRVVRARDLATLVLIDVSESTRDRVPALGTRVIDVEKAAVAMLAEALDKAQDHFALRAFASDSRDKVRWSRVKDFGERFDATAMSRLAGLEPGYSTRLGAALRHAGAELAAVAATRKIVIVLGDGAPSDIDVADPLDLVEDARHAVLGLRADGIEAFGLTLDPGGQGAGAAIFGPARHMPVRRITDLPTKLSALFFRLARR